MSVQLPVQCCCTSHRKHPEHWGGTGPHRRRLHGGDRWGEGEEDECMNVFGRQEGDCCAWASMGVKGGVSVV